MKQKVKDYSKQSEALNEQLFEARNIIGTTRMKIYEWRKDGVLDDKRDKSASNTYAKFSPIDVVWIGIINTIRKLRYTRAEMKAFKEIIFNPIKADDNKTYPALEFYLLQILIYNIPVFIVITHTEKGVEGLYMLDEKNYFSKITSGEIENHTALLLNKIIQTKLNPIYQLPDFNEFASLTKEEIQAIHTIRNKTFKAIKITTRNGDVTSIESVERIEDLDKIEKLIKKGEYQNLEIKQQDGKIVSAHRTIRTSFKRQ